MRIYIAGAYAARGTLLELAGILERGYGHEITSGWLRGTRKINAGTVGACHARPIDEVREHALDDLRQVSDSDVLVQFTGRAQMEMDHTLRRFRLHTGGRHVELGWALAHAVPAVVVGPPENIFQRTLAAAHVEHYEGDLRVIAAELDATVAGLLKNGHMNASPK